MEGEMDIILHHVQHVFIEHVLADVEHVRTVRRTCSCRRRTCSHGT